MRVRLDYATRRVTSPVTPWVHVGADGPWWKASRHIPPMPGPVPGKGWPIWTVEHRGQTLVFASPEEIDHVIDILGRRILPITRELGRPFRAVNSHWLSRLHAAWKPWRVRQDLVKRLRALRHVAKAGPRRS